MRPYRVYGSDEDMHREAHVLPNSRLYVHASVFLPSSDMDPRTGGLRPDSESYRRGRTQAKRMEYVFLEKESKRVAAELDAREEAAGRRIGRKRAVGIFLSMVAMFVLILLVRVGTFVDMQNAVGDLNRQIAACETEIKGVREQIEEASDPERILYAAVQNLKMIPGHKAVAVPLEAMDTRPLETMKKQALAQNEGVQSHEMQNGEEPVGTVIPASASADSSH